MTIIKEYIPEGAKNRPGLRKRPAQWIAVHETDNTARGANAQSYADYLGSPAAAALPTSWHYTVDDTQIIQSVPDEEMAFHCGTRCGFGSANATALSVCLCVNFDGRFIETMRRAAALVAGLLSVHRLPLTALRQACDFSGGNAPKRLRESGGWADFVDMVEDAMDAECWAQRDYDALIAAGVMLGPPRWGTPVMYEDMISALGKLHRALEFDMAEHLEEMRGMLALLRAMAAPPATPASPPAAPPPPTPEAETQRATPPPASKAEAPQAAQTEAPPVAGDEPAPSPPPPTPEATPEQ